MPKRRARGYDAERRARLRAHPQRSEWTRIATEAVIAAANLTGCPWADVLGSRKYREATIARQAALLALYDDGMSYERIGTALIFDFSTVGYHIRRARERFAVDTEFREFVRAAQEAIANAKGVDRLPRPGVRGVA